MTDQDTCMTCKHCQPMAGAWMCGNEECRVYGKEVEADCFCGEWEGTYESVERNCRQTAREL